MQHWKQPCIRLPRRPRRLARELAMRDCSWRTPSRTLQGYCSWHTPGVFACLELRHQTSWNGMLKPRFWDWVEAKKNEHNQTSKSPDRFNAILAETTPLAAVLGIRAERIGVGVAWSRITFSAAVVRPGGTYSGP